MRLFPFLFCQGLFHDANSALHRRLGSLSHAAMSDGQYGWLSCQQFARTREGEPFMPGRQRRQGKEQFEGPRNGNTAQRLEGVAGDHRAVPGIEKSEMAWGVSWRGKHFEGADAISFVQQERRCSSA